MTLLLATHAIVNFVPCSRLDECILRTSSAAKSLLIALHNLQDPQTDIHLQYSVVGNRFRAPRKPQELKKRLICTYVTGLHCASQTFASNQSTTTKEAMVRSNEEKGPEAGITGLRPAGGGASRL
jgi:hypothetical protein